MFTIGEIIIIAVGFFILGAVTVSLPEVEIMIGKEGDEIKQARYMPAECPECGWEGKLTECIQKRSRATLLNTFLRERCPTCPKCTKMVHW